MAKLVHVLTVVGIVACLLLATACGREPTPSPSPSPPLAELRALAERYRTPGEGRAWWVRVPASDAARLLDLPMSAFHGETYFVVLYGDYRGGDGEPYPWAYVAADLDRDHGLWITNRRPDTGGRPWTALVLSSPEPSALP